jgi:hypothetical protein
VTGKRGRPPKPEAKRQLRAQEAQRLLEKKLAKPQPSGRKAGRKEAIKGVADAFGVSTRTVERWLAAPPSTAQPVSWFTGIQIDAKIDKLHPHVTNQRRAVLRERYLEELSQAKTMRQRWRLLADEDDL